MKKMQKNRGITLIALVITIIVLLILAAISIATLTGENGILTKADQAGKRTDTEETKEQIKIELMGTLDNQKNDYTNQDVIEAVKKITEKEVEENTPSVKSKKGNDVDIQDLWVGEDTISINILRRAEGWGDENIEHKLKIASNTTWEKFIEENEMWQENKAVPQYELCFISKKDLEIIDEINNTNYAPFLISLYAYSSVAGGTGLFLVGPSGEKVKPGDLIEKGTYLLREYVDLGYY